MRFLEKIIKSVNITRYNYGDVSQIEMEIIVPYDKQFAKIDEISNYMLDELLTEKCGMTFTELKNTHPELFI